MIDIQLVKDSIDSPTFQMYDALSRLERTEDGLKKDVLVGKRDPLELLLVQKKIETLLVNYDNTGAKREAALGEQLSEDLDTRGLTLDEKGHLVSDETDKDQYMCMVTLVDLDRVNTEGGHTAGNNVLSMTVIEIESTIMNIVERDERAKPLRKIPLENLYSIYHTRGSDFTIMLNLPGVQSPELLMSTIMQKISEIRPKPALNIEGSPLGTTWMRRDKAIEKFNEYQDKLKDRELTQLQDKKSIKRSLIDFWTKSNQLALEEKLLKAKGGEFIGMLERNDENAQKYFQLYVAKYFNETDMETAESFDVTGSSKAERLHAGVRVRNKMDQVILDKIANGLAADRQAMKTEDQVMVEVLAGEKKLPDIKKVAEEDERKAASLPTIEAAKLMNRRAGTNSSEFKRVFEESIQEGSAIIAKLTEDPQNVSESDITALKRLRDFADIPVSLVIGEQKIEVRSVVDAAIGRIASGIGDPKDVVKIAYLHDIAKQEYATRLKRIDAMTGLGNNTEYYLKMKEFHKRAETLEEGKSVRTLFIDLGFLKYFNTGGRDVGNSAIQMTAEILEDAINKSELEGQVFRYAGDEFTCVFIGTADDEKRLIDILEDLKERSGVVLRTERSSPMYRPEKIVINYGTADHTMAEQAIQTLVEKNVIPKSLLQEDEHGNKSDEYYRRLGIIQTRLADMGIETQKAYSRFSFLMRRIRQDFPKNFPKNLSLEQRQTGLLVKYSQKAIFGMSLEKLHEMAYSMEYDTRIPEGQANIHKLIKEKKVIETKEKYSKREAEDALLMFHLIVDSLDRRLAEKDAELAERTMQYLQGQEKIQELQEEIKGLRRDVAKSKMKELQELLAAQEHHGATIDTHRKHITGLQAEKTALIEGKNAMQVGVF